MIEWVIKTEYGKGEVFSFKVNYVPQKGDEISIPERTNILEVSSVRHYPAKEYGNYFYTSINL